jgi:hypothetical protein
MDGLVSLLRRDDVTVAAIVRTVAATATAATATAAIVTAAATTAATTATTTAVDVTTAPARSSCRQRRPNQLRRRLSFRRILWRPPR